MKKVFVLIITLLAFNAIKAQYLIDGERLDNIQIGKSTISDVIANYGTDYKLKKNSDYSNALVYEKLGLIFYSCQSDPDQEIFTIVMQSPFNVQTSKGIILGKSTFEDVYKTYGRWEKTSAGFEYEKVGFYFDTDLEIFDDFESDNRNFAQAKKTAVQNYSNSKNNNFAISPDSNTQSNSNYNVAVNNSKQNRQFENNSVNQNKILNNTNSSNSNNKTTEEKDFKSEIDLWGSKIVKKIELIEKGRLRQCYTDFTENY